MKNALLGLLYWQKNHTIKFETTITQHNTIVTLKLTIWQISRSTTGTIVWAS